MIKNGTLLVLRYGFHDHFGSKDAPFSAVSDAIRHPKSINIGIMPEEKRHCFLPRKATRLDNAVAENFFGILKTELLYLQDFSSVEQFKAALIEYLTYYNNRRIKAKLNGLRPVEYRIQAV